MKQNSPDKTTQPGRKRTRKSSSGRSRRSTKSTSRLRWILIAAAMLLAAVCGGFLVWYFMTSSQKYRGDAEVRIFIPANSSDAAITDTLTAHLGDDFAKSVMRLRTLMRGKASAAEGSYIVVPGTKAGELSKRITKGRQDPLKVTFNNVRTIDQLAERIAAKLELSSDEFLAACDSVLPALGYDKPNYMAAFLPDTYEFYWNISPNSLIEKLSAQSRNWWTAQRIDKASALGLTPQDVYTLASIVDEETAKADEKPKVARLYLNRLKQGMRLQADPTVKFAFGDFSLRRINSTHLRTESPYNTYLHAGLPPGPIRMVPASTLEAVLDAPAHDYIFMCAKEDFSGYHNFAVTAAEHAQNARRYHEALNRRGIK